MTLLGRMGGAAVVVAVVAGGGWFVAQRRAHEVLDQAVDQFRAHLGPDVRLSYASAVPSVLHRDARFAGVVLAGPDSTVTADAVVVGCDADSVCSGTADGVGLTTPDASAVSGTAEHVGWTRLSVPGAGESGGAGGFAQGALGGRFDAAEVRGVRLTGSGGEVAVAAAAMSDYGVGRRGRGSVDGMSVSVPDPSAGAAGAAGSGPGSAAGGTIRLGLAHASFDGVDVASVAGAMRSGVPVAAQGRQSLEASGLDVAQGGAALLHVGRLASVQDTSDAGVAHGVADATELRLDGPPALVEGLRGLGYAAFEGGVHVDATLDRAASELAIAALRLSGQGMGEASLSGGFGHVPQGAGAGAAGPAAMLGVTVRGFDLVLVDGGLTGRLVEAKAKASGMDPGQLREAVAGQLAGLPVSSEAARSVRAALAAFVRAPGTLTLGVHPAAPVSLLDMAQVAGRGPDGVVAALGVTAAAK